MQCTYYNTYYLIQLRKKSNYINMRARVYISHPARGALRRIVLLCRLQRTSRRICTQCCGVKYSGIRFICGVIRSDTYTHTAYMRYSLLDGKRPRLYRMRSATLDRVNRERLAPSGPRRGQLVFRVNSCDLS